MTGDVCQAVNDWTEETVAALHEKWGTQRSLDPIEYGPVPWHHDAPPDSLEEQLSEFAGMASVVVFRSERRVETVLVYHRAGYWEPPGGAIEDGKPPAEIARMEAREEANVDIELTELLYTRPVHYQYEDGSSVSLPAVTFVGRETGGELRPERATSKHPYATHGVGVFGRDVLPENCRDGEYVVELFEGYPPYDPEPPEFESG